MPTKEAKKIVEPETLYKSDSVHVDEKKMEDTRIFKLSFERGTPSDDVVRWCYDNLMIPHQIQSSYDCTGKPFVMGLDFYPKGSNGEHYAERDIYLVEQHWTVDV